MKRTLIVCIFLFLMFSIVIAEDVISDEVNIFVSKGETNYLLGVDSMWGGGFYTFFSINGSSSFELDGDFGFGSQPSGMKYERENFNGRFDLGLLKGKLNRIILMLQARYSAEAKVFPENIDMFAKSEWWRQIEFSLGVGARILGEYNKSYFTVTGVLGILNFKNYEVLRAEIPDFIKELTEEAIVGYNLKGRYQIGKLIWLDGDVSYLYPVKSKDSFYEVRFGAILKLAKRFGIRGDLVGISYAKDYKGYRAKLTIRVGGSYFF